MSHTGLLCCCVLVLACAAPAGAAAPDRVPIEDFEGDRLPLSPNEDGGTAPGFSVSDTNAKTGKKCLRLEYRNGERGYGNLRMPVWLSGAEEAVELWVRKEKAREKANLFVWFFEEDGDAWVSPGTGLAALGEGWQLVSLKLADFRYDPRGDKAKSIGSVDRMLIGCNFADFTICVDGIALVGNDLAARRNKVMDEVDVSCEVDPESLLCGDVIGIGAEWNPYVWLDVPEEHWKLVEERIRWMKLPAARVLILARWCLKEGWTFDWESREMKILYRHLDICQREGITVFLTDWGCVRDWVKAPGIRNTADPKYAEAIGTYLEHLIRKKGYDCITYFILVNEPNNEAGGYDDWKQGVLNVAKELEARKLDAQVTIAGSDASQVDGTWHRNAVDQLQGTLGAYDLHLYAGDADVKAGRLEDTWRGLWGYALQKDPEAKKKRFVVGEAGLNDGAVHPSGNRNIDSYHYGIFMADYAVQAVRAGSHAVLAWMLCDNSHKGFFWGCWSNSEKGLELRPWFYTWSLLSRYIPPGSDIHALKQTSSAPPAYPAQVRVLAAKAPGADGKKGGWTFCIVNRDTRRSASVTLRVPDGGRAKMKRYVYREDDRRTDEKGFPVPEAAEDADLSKGHVVKCPKNAVVVVTSVER